MDNQLKKDIEIVYNFVISEFSKNSEGITIEKIQNNDFLRNIHNIKLDRIKYCIHILKESGNLKTLGKARGTKYIPATKILQWETFKEDKPIEKKNSFRKTDKQNDVNKLILIVNDKTFPEHEKEFAKVLIFVNNEIIGKDQSRINWNHVTKEHKLKLLDLLEKHGKSLIFRHDYFENGRIPKFIDKFIKFRERGRSWDESIMDLGLASFSNILIPNNEPNKQNDLLVSVKLWRKKLREARDSGILTEDEYQNKMNELLELLK